jgi:hypothetical protein
VALHYLAGFSERFTRAVHNSEELIRALGESEAFTIERIPLGTNLFRLRVHGTDATAYQNKLAAMGVMLPAPSPDGRFVVGVNETLNRTTTTTLADTFRRALSS